MKCRISITIDEETYYRIAEAMRKRKFKNKSHLVEKAIKRMLRKGP
ncbi:MAG: ribbon-helix-helix domain-containing protein [Nanoarchaeota archaeon]|nr:ribbon-helix-helix domain-containing protein [Nanoarchaeota archaeon]